MTDDSTYLDYASSTPLRDAARTAAQAALDTFGDPLRIHGAGRTARTLLEGARAAIAEGLGAQPDEIVFTSGGTESVSLAIWGTVRAIRELGTRIVVGGVEHPAVYGVGHALETDGFEVVRVRVDDTGRVDLDEFASQVRVPGTVLASLQHANHEIGTIQPIGEAARICREAKVLFHTDACQTAGRLPLDVSRLDVDLLSLSAHKFGGPAGAGVLFVRRGVGVAAYPCGDDRERKRRAGMENLPGVAGMTVAFTTALKELGDEAARLWTLTERLGSGIAERVPHAALHGHRTHRVPHIACFSVVGLDPETLMMALDDRGFRIGGGSLCSGAPGEPSPVLEAIGVPGTPSFPLSVGFDTTEASVDALLEVLPGLVSQLQGVEATSSEALGRFRVPGDADRG
ncbi:MAG: cysteine desulfurase family protein [Actinomycetota bacterium]